jgi:hypothetical protein
MSDILVNMLKKEKKRAADAIAATEQQNIPLPKSANYHADSEASFPLTSSQRMTNGTIHDSHRSISAGHQVASESRPSSGKKYDPEQQKMRREKEEKTKAKICKFYNMQIF